MCEGPGKWGGLEEDRKVAPRLERRRGASLGLKALSKGWEPELDG